jgi:transcriptional regulator with XRE-family HTH domain
MKRQNGLSAEQGRQVADRVLEELARRRMSRATLASDARISLSTLEKVLSGRRALTLATAVRLEDALGVKLRQGGTTATAETPANNAATAPDELGGYARTAVAWLEGSYLTIRPSLSGQGALYTYRTDITWNAERAVLSFREAERLDTDFTQFGDVAVPHQSGHIYLVTNRHGQHRLVILGRPTITGELHGLLSTLQAGRGSHLSPVSMPVVMQPIKPGATPSFGRIPQAHAEWRNYSALLRKTVNEHFAQFLTG